MEVLGAMKELRRVIVEISALIVIWIVAEGLPSHGMYIYVRIFLLQSEFPLRQPPLFQIPGLDIGDV
jgi:hypothetical protein